MSAAELKDALAGRFGEWQGFRGKLAVGEVTVRVPPPRLVEFMTIMRDDPAFHFEQLIDLCGIDYCEYSGWEGARFAVVYHLLSLSHNRRLRVRAYCEDDDFPALDSVVPVWPSANWFEREAFDLYGIVFHGHSDLRRLLTDYGFVGHPFRKDFPLSGKVEVRYDPVKRRVIYQPVTIPPREVVPRIVRESEYGKEESDG